MPANGAATPRRAGGQRKTQFVCLGLGNCSRALARRLLPTALSIASLPPSCRLPSVPSAPACLVGPSTCRLFCRPAFCTILVTRLQRDSSTWNGAGSDAGSRAGERRRSAPPDRPTDRPAPARSLAVRPARSLYSALVSCSFLFCSVRPPGWPYLTHRSAFAVHSTPLSPLHSTHGRSPNPNGARSEERVRGEEPAFARSPLPCSLSLSLSRLSLARSFLLRSLGQCAPK